MKIKNVPAPAAKMLKARTGIEGFDEITHGGLPCGRMTLLEGGPGSGKTIMALQTLVNGARLDNEPGIFVAFEESAARIMANSASFGWDLAELQKQKLFFMDAQPSPDLVVSGKFDLSGMLAALEAKAKEIKARRFVFDAVDVLLALLHDPVAERREMYRLHEWLLKHGFTALITSKKGGGASVPQMSFMQFMVDCTVTLSHEFILGVSQRNLRVVKYRGSAFQENESPFAFGVGGLEVAGSRSSDESTAVVSNERVSSGVERLDTMLDGGYYRGSTILVSGFPGTAKTTLAGAFLEAACLRGEQTLFVSFDSDANEVNRNLASVGIKLERFVKKGRLHTKSARSLTGSAEIHLMRIKDLARHHKVRCLVIDPVSALAKSGNEETAYHVAERLIDWTKDQGITLLCTSLLHEAGSNLEGTPMQVSTIADTWLHLSYVMQSGERNRGLSIVKSRGMAHSNQVRELILSNEGVTLADTYTAGGEVLMGTLRWEKEDAVRTATEENKVAAKLKRVTLESEEALLEVRLKALQLELQVKRSEKEALSQVASDLTEELASGKSRLHQLRGGDKA